MTAPHMRALPTKSVCQLCEKLFHAHILKSQCITPFIKATSALLCSRITHFHSCGCPLSLLSNQVNLFIFISHVFFCYIINPPWTSCRKQQSLRVVLRAWKERPSTSDISTDHDTWEVIKKQELLSHLTAFYVPKVCTRCEETLSAISFSWLSKP